MRRLEPAALGRFFDEYFDRVFAVVARLCQRREDAEDLTQEVFLRAQKAAPSLDPGRDPWPWLVSIAFNRWRDRARAGGRSPLRTSSVTLEARPPLANLEDGPMGIALQKERAALVQGAIEDLPDAQRAAVLLRDYAGLSHEAIGEVTGSSTLAARKCYSRAIATLGSRLRGRLE